MKTRIYAAPAVKGLSQTLLIVLRSLLVLSLSISYTKHSGLIWDVVYDVVPTFNQHRVNISDFLFSDDQIIHIYHVYLNKFGSF